MSKKSLEKRYKELFSNVWSELMFYIAESELTTKLAGEFEGVDMSDIFNRVYIVDKMLGPIEYKKEFSHRVFSKSLILEDNMYLLLKMKQKLDVQEFDFLLEKYFKDAKTCFLISNLIVNDLESRSSTQINNIFKGALRMQYSAYKEHLGKLIKHFYPNKSELPETNINILEILEEQFPNLLKKDKGIFNIDVARLPKYKRIGLNKTKKDPLLTEKDAEMFLLESVFNLKING